ncbi:hypothetical protein [Flavobacterium lacus]|uniref:Uncharacterized protein n=1 Tax=Flavobacterium lacus TaxID=1353778 RepID=A0A328WQR4_9FLAO|nr:hypothetical protein [Flavobacterium lacus]RAR46717.1 hypothetical protein B0I10_11525 [Flavobacterium lacus]
MKNFLLPYYFKIIGLSLILIGILFSVFYLKYDFKYTTAVFALVSMYMENRFFVITQTNTIDEIILILFVVGFGLLVFSKEKSEAEFFTVAREKALVKASIANTIFILISIIFIYGAGFVAILVLNLITVFIFYLLFFYFSLNKIDKKT